MEHIEKMVKQFEAYQPEKTKRADHWAFWQQTIKMVKEQPLHAELTDLTYPIKQVTAYELSYHGFDKTPIKAYYMLPEAPKENLPCLIIFHGYGGGKQSVSQYMHWLVQGYAVIAVDCRGHGKSGDYSTYNSDAQGTWVTKGILQKEEYYYRKVYMDGLRAIDFACSRPEIDGSRIGIMGGSMGGGITLAVAALDERPKLAIADIPNMCDIPLAMEQKFEGSLTHVEAFLHRYPETTEKVFANLSYFDNLNLSEHIGCRTRITVGLRDPICPPQTIFGVYNSLTALKSMEIYPFSGHDLNITGHTEKTIEFVQQYL